MKAFIINLFLLISLLSVTVSCSKKNENKTDERLNEVVVYTYDSFAGEWGPGPELSEKFEKATGLKLTLVDCGDAIQAYNRAVLEKDNVQADIVIGIDNTICKMALASGILEQYSPKDADTIIPAQLRHSLDEDNFLIPYDYSHFTLIYDTTSSVPEPQQLSEITDEIYRNKIILMDPRTSTPGRLFLAWTVSMFGDETEEFISFWKALKPNILTMTASWSEGWGMFLNGEAPLVISQTTSPAYNVEYDNNYNDISLVFEEGHVQQVEGYALLKNAPNKKGAQIFMDYFITEEAQSILPLTQWMYPVNENVILPESYKEAAPVPQKTLPLDVEATDKAVNIVLDILSK